VNSTNGEWSSSDKLPEGFVNWLIELIDEQDYIEGKGFSRIAEELGVQASILSRWMGGMGPLSQNNIENLASNLGNIVYTYLHIPWPDDDD
jgi:hypothetical protein